MHVSHPNQSYLLSHTLIDGAKKRIFGILAGRPRIHADDWDSVKSSAVAAIDLLGCRLTFTAEDCDHHRGPHKTKSFGFSHGGGQTQPSMLRVGDQGNEAALAEFAKDPSIKCLTGFANCEYCGSPLFLHVVNSVQQRSRSTAPSFTFITRTNWATLSPRNQVLIGYSKTVSFQPQLLTSGRMRYVGITSISKTMLLDGARFGA
jgi:hypothetical protein